MQKQTTPKRLLFLPVATGLAALLLFTGPALKAQILISSEFISTTLAQDVDAYPGIPNSYDVVSPSNHEYCNYEL